MGKEQATPMVLEDVARPGWFSPLKTGCVLIGIVSAAGAFAQSPDVDRHGNVWSRGAPDVWQVQTPPDRLPSAPAPAPEEIRGYRFRGDPVLPGEAWRAPDDQEVYRFRPLSEQEKARMGQTPDSDWRYRQD